MKLCIPLRGESDQEKPDTLRHALSPSHVRGCVKRSIRKLRSKVRHFLPFTRSQDTVPVVEETHERQVLDVLDVPNESGTHKGKEKQQSHGNSAPQEQSRDDAHRLAANDLAQIDRTTATNTDYTGACAREETCVPEGEPHFTLGPVRIISARDGVDNMCTALLLNSSFADSVRAATQARQTLAITLSRTQDQDKVSSIRVYALKASIDTEQHRLREIGQALASPDLRANESDLLKKRADSAKAKLREFSTLFEHEITEQKSRQRVLQVLYRDCYEVQEEASQLVETAFISAGLLPPNDSAPGQSRAFTNVGRDHAKLDSQTGDFHQRRITGDDQQTTLMYGPRSSTQNRKQQGATLSRKPLLPLRHNAADHDAVVSREGIASLQNIKSDGKLHSHEVVPVKVSDTPPATASEANQALEDAFARGHNASKPHNPVTQPHKSIPSAPGQISKDISPTSAHHEPPTAVARKAALQDGNLEFMTNGAKPETPSNGKHTHRRLRREYKLTKYRFVQIKHQFDQREETNNLIKHAVKSWELDRSFSKRELDLRWIRYLSRLTKRLTEAEKAFKQARIAAINGGLELSDTESIFRSDEDADDGLTESTESYQSAHDPTEMVEKWRHSIVYTQSTPCVGPDIIEDDVEKDRADHSDRERAEDGMSNSASAEKMPIEDQKK